MQFTAVRLGVEYLAFYQSMRSFGQDGGVSYYAKIKDFYKYKRGECKEIPTTKERENEIYLRFDLEDIQELPTIKLIQFGPQLLSYTTLYLLKNAENTHELKLQSNLEIEVYKILKKMAARHRWSIRKQYNQYLINGNSIEIVEGRKIRVNGEITNIKNIERLLWAMGD